MEDVVLGQCHDQYIVRSQGAEVGHLLFSDGLGLFLIPWQKLAARAIVAGLLLTLMAQYSPANSAVSAYRYRGGSGDGWDCQQASPAMYCGGAGAGSSMNTSSNFSLINLTDYPRKISLGADQILVHWYVYDITQVNDYDRTQPYGVHWFTDLRVKCSSGWEESGLMQTPQTAWLIPPREYAPGTYTTTWYHVNYYNKRLVFAVDTNEVRNFVYMHPRWTSPYRVLAIITSESTNYMVNAWLETTSGSPAPDAGNCRLNIVNANADELISAFQASPNSEGYFRIPLDISNLSGSNTYLAKIGIDDFSGNIFSNTITFGLYVSGGADLSQLSKEHAEIFSNTTAIIAQTEGIRSNTMLLGTSYNALSASYSTLAPKIDVLGTKMDASLAGVDSIKAAVGATEPVSLSSRASQTLDAVAGLPAAIKREAKKGVQSKILNRPVTATNGATLTIRYKTDTGTTPQIDVYDPNNAALVTGGMMTNEINSSGVYEYNLQLLAQWSLGEYTIICSESTTASADSMTLKVVASEGGGAGDLAAVLEKLDALNAKLDSIAADQSTINSTLSAQSAKLTTLSDGITAINITLKTMSDNVNALLENWNSINMTDLKSQIDLLVKYTGTPNDPSGMQTLFGKIAQTYGLVNQVPVAAVFAEVQGLRKEIDFQHKSDTTYSMLADISAAIDDLQVATTEKTKEAATSELREAAKAVQETRETLSAIAKQAGVGNVLSVSTAGGKDLSLLSLYDQMAELKALSQAILDLSRQREKPVVKTWLESGSVKRRILVANHSPVVEEVVPVKEYLPEGTKPEDIISMGDFKLAYDFDRSLYYVHQDIKLQPKASVTLEVVMNDIWRIDGAEIVMLKEHVKRLGTILEKSRYADQVKIMRDNIFRRLDKIIQNQDAVVATERRLSTYEMNKAALEDIKNNVGTLEDLVVEVQGLPVDKIMGKISPVAPTAAGVSAGAALPPKKKIVMKIEMANPLAISNTTPLEYPLPTEINPELITELGGLEVRYNPEKKLHYLTKENLAFAPHEKKSFAVELNDIWYIPNQQIHDLLSHTEKLVGMFANSDARPSAEFLGKRITQELTAIDKSQQQTDLTADIHIGTYRVNVKRMEDVKKDIARLERLIVQTGGSPGLTMATRDVKIKEGGAIPAAGSKARALITENTWKIIWAIIAFTGIISFLFFMIWWMQIKKKENVKLERLDTVEKKASGKPQ